MVEILKSAEQRAADELATVLLKRMEGKTAKEVAALAHVQSVLSKAAVQAIVDVLVQKGIFTANDLGAALKHHYNRSHDHAAYGKAGDSGPVVARPQ